MITDLTNNPVSSSSFGFKGYVSYNGIVDLSNNPVTPDLFHFAYCNNSVEKFVFKEAIGTIDGINDTFETVTNYTPGTLKVFHNGRMTTKFHDDGFDEDWPPYFVIKFEAIPGDIIFTFYRECSS